MKKAQSERRVDRENTTPPSSSSGCSSMDDIISQPSLSSTDLEPLVANYAEFEVGYSVCKYDVHLNKYIRNPKNVHIWNWH